MKTDVYERITERVLESIERGVVPWTKPWTAGVNVPRSMSSLKPYRGINTLLLGLEAFEKGYDAPWWGTYKQIKEQLGGQVRKGEKSTTVLLWKPMERVVDGETKRFFWATAFNVFNVGQADWPDGVPAKFVPPALIEHDVVAEAEALIAGYAKAPEIVFGGDQPAYSPGRDKVIVPPLNRFHTVEGYYSTMFHELTHSTGHETRLKREGIAELDVRDKHKYSKEELVAEMGAAMLCAVAGMESEIDQSAAYIAGWLRSLKNDPKMIVQAAAQAQRAADHIRGEKVESYD